MADADTQDAARRLLLDPSNTVGDGKVSWAQTEIKLVVAEDAADGIEKGGRDTCTTRNSRKV